MEKCSECKYFKFSPGTISGKCLRLPPHIDHRGHVAFWPIVRGYSWCGEFKQREIDMISATEARRICKAVEENIKTWGEDDYEKTFARLMEGE